jgi:hypothetical protein
MTDESHWLNIYVMLSRATTIKKLFLLGLTSDIWELLKRGPPTHFQSELKRLEALASKRREALATMSQST